ncbi:MAG: U32 family peptidase [Eubacteriales bacterium]|nr:U32 family peptidase [Eubacteriales bacterium]
MAELLAPAGNMQALQAAVKAGADAVYLGMQAFGARAGAGNFSLEELQTARNFTAIHGVKIYITLNTLIKEKELKSLIPMLYALGDIVPDAVIVQDIGLARLVRQILPNMPLHASTQMGILTASGAKFLKSMGFSRVVLARECSLQTIAEVVAMGLEVEVFVHGALCVSMSGQCLLSSFIGGRSGNRGRCAQPCRQTWGFHGNTQAWLSTKDIMLYNELPQLLKIGVHSFKIEGRLKSPSYVANVVHRYKQGMQKVQAGIFENLSKQEYIDLLQSFNRGDFSYGYAGGSQDAGIINPGRSNNHGVLVGKVASIAKNLLHIALCEDIQAQDMLRVVCGAQAEDFELIYSGKNQSRGEIATTFLRADNHLQVGMPVYRLISQAQADWEQALPKRTETVQAKLWLFAEQEAKVELQCGHTKVQVQGALCQAAQNAPLSQKSIQKAFQKTGDFPFVLQSVELHSNGVFMPMAQLNALRREAYEALQNAILQQNILPQVVNTYQESRAQYNNSKDMIVCSSNLALQNELQMGEVFVYEPLDNRFQSLQKDIALLRKDAFLLLHTNMDDATAEAVITSLKEHQIRGVVIDNIGQLGLCLEGLQIAIGAHVPVCNHLALQALLPYEPQFICVFPELTLQEQKDIGIDFALLYYGKERMMIFNHCPARTALGLQSNKEHCTMCHTGHKDALNGKSFLDRKAYDYPLQAIFTDGFCIVQMLNSKASNLTSKQKLLKHSPKYIRFVQESLPEQIAILQAVRQGNVIEGGTLGHFEEGVL